MSRPPHSLRHGNNLVLPADYFLPARVGSQLVSSHCNRQDGVNCWSQLNREDLPARVGVNWSVVKVDDNSCGQLWRSPGQLQNLRTRYAIKIKLSSTD